MREVFLADVGVSGKIGSGRGKVRKLEKELSKSMSDVNNLSPEAMMAWRMNIFARNTQEHLARRAAEEEAAVLKDAQDIENRKIMAGILAENERKAAVEAFQMREVQNRNLEEELKRQFMMANPAATEYSWLSVKEQIKQDYFIERFNAEKTRDDIEKEIYAAWKM
jgi:hypothetical protein